MPAADPCAHVQLMRRFHLFPWPYEYMTEDNVDAENWRISVSSYRLRLICSMQCKDMRLFGILGQAYEIVSGRPLGYTFDIEASRRARAMYTSLIEADNRLGLHASTEPAAQSNTVRATRGRVVADAPAAADAPVIAAPIQADAPVLAAPVQAYAAGAHAYADQAKAHAQWAEAHAARVEALASGADRHVLASGADRYAFQQQTWGGDDMTWGYPDDSSKENEPVVQANWESCPPDAKRARRMPVEPQVLPADANTAPQSNNADTDTNPDIRSSMFTPSWLQADTVPRDDVPMDSTLLAHETDSFPDNLLSPPPQDTQDEGSASWWKSVLNLSQGEDQVASDPVSSDPAPEPSVAGIDPAPQAQ